MTIHTQTNKPLSSPPQVPLQRWLLVTVAFVMSCATLQVHANDRARYGHAYGDSALHAARELRDRSQALRNIWRRQSGGRRDNHYDDFSVYDDGRYWRSRDYDARRSTRYSHRSSRHGGKHVSRRVGKHIAHFNELSKNLYRDVKDRVHAGTLKQDIVAIDTAQASLAASLRNDVGKGRASPEFWKAWRKTKRAHRHVHDVIYAGLHRPGNKNRHADYRNPGHGHNDYNNDYPYRDKYRYGDRRHDNDYRDRGPRDRGTPARHGVSRAAADQVEDLSERVKNEFRSHVRRNRELKRQGWTGRLDGLLSAFDQIANTLQQRAKQGGGERPARQLQNRAHNIKTLMASKPVGQTTRRLWRNLERQLYAL